MKRKSINLATSSLVRRFSNGKLVVNHEYQRDLVWKKAQKQLLVDSILNDIDIPKIYITENKDKKPEVVDGQQRLDTIKCFKNDEFALSADNDTDEYKEKKYSQLSDDAKDKFDEYQFDVIVLEDTSDDDIKDMFLRLQNGSTLNAAEKRNAMPGNMPKFTRKFAEDPFFENCQFSGKRRAYENIIAQMTVLEFAGRPVNISSTDLVRLFNNKKDFNDASKEAKNIRKTLKILCQIFSRSKDKPKLVIANVISLFLVLRELQENFAIDGQLDKIREWFDEFERARAEDEQKDTDERDKDLLDYQSNITSTTDKVSSLEARHNFLMRKLFEYIPNLKNLDEQRTFTSHQRRAIWYRDKGECQLKIKCTGEKCSWDNWEADHKMPHSKGGKTTVENGQVACVGCNKVKSNKVAM